MNVAGLQEFTADGLARATLEEDAIGYDDGGAATLSEQGNDVLHEVELFVAGAGPEVLANGNIGGTFLASHLVDNGGAALASKGRISQHHVKMFAGWTEQTVIDANGRFVAFVTTDAVQEKVHQTEARGIVYDLPAAQGIEL